MSSFTIPLKKVIKLTGGTVTIENNVRKMEGGNIGLSGYAIFDEAYRPHLNGRIIDHYWNREICTESIEMFQLAMRRKMNEIMPYFNKFYLSERIAYEPLLTIDLHTVINNSAEQTSTGSSDATTNTTNTSKSRAVNSDFPQVQLSGNGDYATNGADSNASVSLDGESSEQNNNSSNTESNGDTRITGFQGSASDLIMRYRESLLNIDLRIIDELQDCFMSVWNTGESFTKGYTL